MPTAIPWTQTEQDDSRSPGGAVQECLDRLSQGGSRQVPLSTYRVQFNHKFRFRDALALVPYLKRLGVSTLYASPILRARAGSTHGYDIIDHNQLNEEIGTEAEFQQLIEELHAREMTLVLDVVPNHMGVGYGTNPWWQDVLQNGPASRFADFFDIDWDPLKEELHNKVLLPVLGNPYGEELESGRLKVVFTGREFLLEYYDRVQPIDPQTYPLIFQALGEPQASSAVRREFLGLMAAFAELPAHDEDDSELALRRQRQVPYLTQRLQELVARSPELQEYVERALARVNGASGDPHSFDALHNLLEHQAYRLAHWRVSAEEINYRRFFDINDLIGLRMEDPRVFAATQGLIRRLLATGAVSGLRIDHPDGLFNPQQYLQRLQMLYAASQCYGPVPQGPLAENGIEADLQYEFGLRDWRKHRAPLYVVVEKILEFGEELPSDWPVAGTVGYEFGNLLTNLFIDSRAERSFTNLYARFTGAEIDLGSLVYQSKKLIMHSALSSEVNVLAHLLDELSSLDRHARDFTRKSLRDAIREVIACFPIYRTYIDERGNIADRDRKFIEQAIRTAKQRNSSIPGPVFDFLRNILLLQGNDGGSPVHGYRKQLYFTLKFQQLTGPVMAKGLEDTACYIYNRFVAVNEVGGAPGAFGVTENEFHSANLKRATEWPHQMLTTSTHDTKRSEDVRARLAVLSELPQPWANNVLRWRRINKGRKSTISDGRVAPDLNEEYLLYQTLIGTWPLPADPEMGFAISGEAQESYVARMRQYMTKAINEAKVNMSWINPDAEYAQAVERFVERILTPGTVQKPNSFLRMFEDFVPRVAYFGVVNTLAQTVAKLTAPGVPDIYQGQELLDFSLVDPDNRRRVDFAARERLLATMEAEPRDFETWWKHWTDGRLKLWVTRQALAARQRLQRVFERGDYIPLRASGGRAAHVVAYARVSGPDAAITVFPRFACTLMKGEMRRPLGGAWEDTQLEIPVGNGKWTNLMTGESFEARSVAVAELLRQMPVALLVSE